MIVPAIIAKTYQELREKVELVESFPRCRRVQIDIMDGKFVRNMTIPVGVVEKVKTRFKKNLNSISR